MLFSACTAVFIKSKQIMSIYFVLAISVKLNHLQAYNFIPTLHHL
jgi:hypothetical protein